MSCPPLRRRVVMPICDVQTGASHNNVVGAFRVLNPSNRLQVTVAISSGWFKDTAPNTQFNAPDFARASIAQGSTYFPIPELLTNEGTPLVNSPRDVADSSVASAAGPDYLAAPLGTFLGVTGWQAPVPIEAQSAGIQDGLGTFPAFEILESGIRSWLFHYSMAAANFIGVQTALLAVVTYQPAPRSGMTRAEFEALIPDFRVFPVKPPNPSIS